MAGVAAAAYIKRVSAAPLGCAPLGASLTTSTAMVPGAALVTLACLLSRACSVVLRGSSVSLTTNRPFDVGVASDSEMTVPGDLTVPGKLFFMGRQMPSAKYYDGTLELIHKPDDGSCAKLVYVGEFTACPRRSTEAFVLCRELRFAQSPSYPGLSLDPAHGTLLRVRNADPLYSGTYTLKVWLEGAANASVFPMTLRVDGEERAHPATPPVSRAAGEEDCVEAGAPTRGNGPSEPRHVYVSNGPSETTTATTASTPDTTTYEARPMPSPSSPPNPLLVETNQRSGLLGMPVPMLIAAGLAAVVIMGTIGACCAIRCCGNRSPPRAPVYRRNVDPAFVEANEAALSRLGDEVKAEGFPRRPSYTIMPSLSAIAEEPPSYRSE